jgi:AcrR family transcriptional regulator
MARPALTSEQRGEQERRQQRQLLRGLAQSIGEKGYGATTIADVVRLARVSKSTFYAHFADKEECFVALYSAATDGVLERMARADREAAEAGVPWPEHLRAVNGAYLEALASGGPLTRSLLVEIQTAGPSAQTMRRDVADRYVRLMRRVVDGLRRAEPRLRKLSDEVVLALVGGINELVLSTIERGPVEAIAGLDDVTLELWAAVLTAPPAPRAGRSAA